MRSGTSFFDGTVFKKTVFRFWPLWGVYFAGWLMALPLSGLMALRTDSYGWTGFGNSMRYFSFNRVPAMGEMALQAEVIFGVLAAMAVFSHLYSARSANLFGSLPIRREGLFLTHYLAGLSFLIVPNVVIFLLTLAVVFGVLAAMAVFSHLYNPRSANLFGSLPIRREGLFLTHYLAGLAFLIVPNAVIFLLCIPPRE